ncbi:transmembrane protein, putative (macronuclear) [Tetrahymena thermophila SB210]|uniref:Transmembrane protein, putative n=1 Tax=Tetrahymena thermophila (strain SB210) TaxID=312017 RepID=I7M8N3_TETTS|nr:transmembrane protein, putative [Tetrahymena thermophila SB210]EAR99346.1 transmembrane protein, putative [Tetrahymena thermophila SB210]|eukprot:XP_001019591.1 transmembrane protein, putative [Tetrahymena thermophila SB210]
MAQRRIYFLLVLFVLCILIQTEAQSIKIPLRFKDNKLVLSTAFGKNQCQIDAEIQFNLCTSIISKLSDNQSTDNCGSESTGEIDLLTGDNIYVAPFDLNGLKTSLTFNIPSPDQTLNYGLKSLCFGFGSYQLQSVLRNLFNQGQIKQPIAYLYLDNVLQNQKKGDVTGFIELGELYQPKIQKSDYLKYLISGNRGSYYSIKNVLQFQFLGQTFNLSTNQSHFNFNSPYYSFSTEVIQQILKTFKKKDIQYKIKANPQKQSSDKSMYIVPYIDQMDDIQVIFTQESTEYSYTISISPETFSRKIENDDYELLFEEVDSGIDFRFGNTIFQSYYFGFNQLDNKIQVAKRGKQKIISI